jgi:hypothetical protein
MPNPRAVRSLALALLVRPLTPLTRLLAPLAMALACFASLLAPPAASAAPEWVAPVDFPVPSSDRFEEAPGADQVVYQSGGIANEAFLQIESLSPLQSTLHVGTMSPGGSYSDQLTLPSGEGAIPTSAQIAVAPDGAAVAAWSELTGPSLTTSPYRYRAAYRPAGAGTWEAPFTIAADSERQEGLSPYLTPAISSGGTAAVGVQHLASGEKGNQEGEPVYRLDVAVHPPSGAWTVQRISPPEESSEGLSLGFDTAGDLTAAYTRRFSEGGSPSTEDDRYTAIVRRRPAASGVWGPEENITGSDITHSVYALHLGEDEAGDAVLAYQYGEVSKTFDVWGVTRQGANGPWSTPAQLVTGNSAPESAAVAPSGVAYVLYSFQGASSNESCEGVLRAPPGGAFTAQRCLSPTEEDTLSGSIAFLGDDAYFAWRGNVPGDSSDATIQGARWLSATTLPDVAHNLDLADQNYGPPTLIDDWQGSVVALYELNHQLRAAAFDGGPPILLGASVPATATAGQPLSLSASLVDLWSGLGAGQPTWSFGDGTPAASGASVTHTFAAPGTYTVTLSAADALQNTTTSTYSIAVRPESESGGPEILPVLTVTLNTPPCSPKLSKRACRRRRASPSAWRTLSGSVAAHTPLSGGVSVQVAVYRTRGGHVFALRGGHFRATTKARARTSFAAAKVAGSRWSLGLPKLAPGVYTILVRATDRAGQASVTVSRTVTLR